MRLSTSMICFACSSSISSSVTENELARGLEGVVAGHDRPGRALHHERPVLAVVGQAAPDGLDVAAAGIAVVLPRSPIETVVWVRL